jgi:hypothetical protein
LTAADLPPLFDGFDRCLTARQLGAVVLVAVVVLAMNTALARLARYGVFITKAVITFAFITAAGITDAVITDAVITDAVINNTVITKTVITNANTALARLARYPASTPSHHQCARDSHGHRH